MKGNQNGQRVIRSSKGDLYSTQQLLWCLLNRLDTCLMWLQSQCKKYVVSCCISFEAKESDQEAWKGYIAKKRRVNGNLQTFTRHYGAVQQISLKFLQKHLSCDQKLQNPPWCQCPVFVGTLQGINISHLGKRKIIFKMPFWGDMLVPWRVFFSSSTFPAFFLSLKSMLHQSHSRQLSLEVILFEVEVPQCRSGINNKHWLPRWCFKTLKTMPKMRNVG